MLFFCFISFFKCASKFASRISPKQWQKIILKLGNICNNLQKKSDIWLSAEGRFELSKTIQQKFCSHFSTIFLVKKSYFLLLMSEINDNDVWNVTFIVRLTHMVQLFGIMALIFQIQQRKWTRMMMGRFVFLIFHCVIKRKGCTGVVLLLVLVLHCYSCWCCAGVFLSAKYFI